MALRRLTKELKDLDANPLNNISAESRGGDLFNWHATILAPEDTPYAGGVFYVHIEFVQDYPFKPPKFRWQTQIFHCNISGDECGNCACCGSTCLDMLRDNWSPANNVSKVLSALYEILCNPDPDRNHGERTVTCQEACELYKTVRNAYNKKARQWAVRYAGAPGDPEPAPEDKQAIAPETIINNNGSVASWQCPLCTFKNNMELEVCSMCYYGQKAQSQQVIQESDQIQQQRVDADGKENEDEAKNQIEEENEVKAWLRNDLKLPQYIDNFMDEGWDNIDTIVHELEENDLVEMGINKKGHRKKIMLWIKRYNS